VRNQPGAFFGVLPSIAIGRQKSSAMKISDEDLDEDLAHPQFRG
jgi:hypothetical protein